VNCRHLGFISAVLALALPLGMQSSFAAGLADDAPPVQAPYTSEMIGAKSILEEMLAKRYRTGLATLLDQDTFTVSAQVEIEPVQQPLAPEDKFALPDLKLGTFEYDRTDPRIPAGLLDKYEIVSAVFSVGLLDTLGKETQEQVTQWLKQRVDGEFQDVGKSSVSFIKKKPVEPKPEPVPPQEKSPLDRLTDLQGLAGVIIACIMMMMALYAWKNTLSKDMLEQRRSAIDLNNTKKTEAKAEPETAPPPLEQNQKVEEVRETRTARQLQTDIQAYLTKIRVLVTQLGPRLEPIMATWSGGGEDGQLKMACFIDAVTEMQESFKVPPSAHEAMAAIFTRMTELSLADKLTIVEKVYWDVVAFKTLGVESMEKPFSYLDQVGTRLVSEALVAENPKMRTLVALHMPEQARAQYLGSLAKDSVEQIIEEAFKLDRISKSDMNQLNEAFKSKFSGASAGAQIEIKPLLARLLETLKPADEISILRQLDRRMGAAMASFKATSATLAFVDAWPDAALARLFSSASPDEVTTILRLIPEARDRVLGVCASLTVQVVEDELSREDRATAETRDRNLMVLRERLGALLAEGQIDLQAGGAGSGANGNVIPMAA
jgi:hypothetical protein